MPTKRTALLPSESSQDGKKPRGARASPIGTVTLQPHRKDDNGSTITLRGFPIAAFHASNSDGKQRYSVGALKDCAYILFLVTDDEARLGVRANTIKVVSAAKYKPFDSGILDENNNFVAVTVERRDGQGGPWWNYRSATVIDRTFTVFKHLSQVAKTFDAARFIKEPTIPSYVLSLWEGHTTWMYVASKEQPGAFPTLNDFTVETQYCISPTTDETGKDAKDAEDMVSGTLLTYVTMGTALQNTFPCAQDDLPIFLGTPGKPLPVNLLVSPDPALTLQTPYPHGNGGEFGDTTSVGCKVLAFTLNLPLYWEKCCIPINSSAASSIAFSEQFSPVTFKNGTPLHLQYKRREMITLLGNLSITEIRKVLSNKTPLYMRFTADSWVAWKDVFGGARVVEDCHVEKLLSGLFRGLIVF